MESLEFSVRMRTLLNMQTYVTLSTNNQIVESTIGWLLNTVRVKSHMSSPLSFIVITNNPDYDNNARIVTDSIENAVGFSHEYEVLVCSPHEVKDERVIWIPDDQGANGCSVAAYNKSYKHSGGDYIFILNDDHRIDANVLKVIPFLEGPAFADRKYKVTSVGAGRGCNKWVSTCIPSLAFPPLFPLTENLKQLRFVSKDRYLIMGYPVFAQETVEEHLGGYLLNPKFKHHYADNWLPFWLGEMGEEPLICDDTPLYPFGTPASTCINDEADYNTFTQLVDDFLSGRNKNYV